MVEVTKQRMTMDEAAEYIVEQLKPTMADIYLKGFGNGFINRRVDCRGRLDCGGAAMTHGQFFLGWVILCLTATFAAFWCEWLP